MKLSKVLKSTGNGLVVGLAGLLAQAALEAVAARLKKKGS